MAGNNRELVKESTIDKDTKARIYSHQDYLICEVEYKGGRLMIVKNYQDTIDGRQQLDTFFRSIKSGEDVEEYFKLKGGLKMSLESVVEEIKKNYKYANEKVEGGNPSTLVGRKARQKGAKERLKQLYTQYKGQLKTRSLFVVTSGDKAEDFANLAKETADFLVAYTDSFYQDLTDRIDSKLYKNPITSSYIIDVMARHFEDIAHSLDIASYPQIVNNQKFNTLIKNKEDVLKLVKKVMNDVVGPEVAALYAFEKLAKDAFDTQFSDKIFPVMVVAGSDTAALIAAGFKTLNPRVFTVAAGDNGLTSATLKVGEVDDKTVVSTLTKIKKEITGKTSKGK